MTAQEMIYRYSIRLHDENNLRVLSKPTAAQINDIKAVKDEILAVLKAEKEAKEKAEADRNAKIAAIAGLTEIRNAIDAVERYHDNFNKMMDDEFNDGVNLPSKPTTSVADLRAKYPRAAAYLRAESYCDSANYRKAAAGSKALERIINGEDCSQALADMESEWNDAVRGAMFND